MGFGFKCRIRRNMDLIEQIDKVLAEAKKDDEYYRSEIGKLRKKIMDAGLDDDSPEVKKMTAEIKKLKKKELGVF